MKGKKEIIIGVVVIAAIGMLVAGVQFLKGENLFEEQYVFTAVYDSADDLIESNQVKYKGVTVGKVISISFIDDEKVRVEFNVKSEIGGGRVQLPIDSKAVIQSADMLGNKQIYIQKGKRDVFAKSGDELIGVNDQNFTDAIQAQFIPLKKKMEELMGSADSIIQVFAIVLNKDARRNIQNSFVGLEQTISTFEKASSNADTLISQQKVKLGVLSDNLVVISSEIRSKNSELKNIIENFSDLSDTLKHAEIGLAIRKANLALSAANSLIDEINNGDGTMGQLIHNKDFWVQFQTAVKDMQGLVSDPRLNMHHTFFGKPKAPKLQKDS